MSIEESLKRLMEIKSGSVRAFAIESGIKYTTLRSILDRGIMNSNVENVFKIANHLGMKPEQLAELDSSDGLIDDIINTSIQLEQPRQKKVYDFAEHQLEEQKAQSVNVYGQTAAGEALEYDQSAIEEEIVSYVPKGTDGALVVRGDSMEPVLKNNELLFFKKTPQVENGDIAVVEIEGNAVTTKKVKYDFENEKIILQSINKKYDDMVFDNEGIRIIGKVLL